MKKKVSKVRRNKRVKIRGNTEEGHFNGTLPINDDVIGDNLRGLLAIWKIYS